MMAGGVCLTFDDNSVEDWLRAADLMEANGARATFFVSSFHILNEAQRDGLRQLAARGHEIGHHTVDHAAATNFLEQGGTMAQYVASQVTPQMQAMQAIGLNPTAFCYPYNRRNDVTDAAMLELFRIVRGRAETVEEALHPHTGNRVLRALSIDLHSSSAVIARDLRDVDRELRAAHDTGQVVGFYAHRISNQPVNHHYITLWGLEHLLLRARQLGLSFHTISELAA